MSDENVRWRVSVLVLVPVFKQTVESRTTASFWQKGSTWVVTTGGTVEVVSE